MDETEVIEEPMGLSSHVYELVALSAALNESRNSEMDKRLLTAADIVLSHMVVITHPAPGVKQ